MSTQIIGFFEKTYEVKIKLNCKFFISFQVDFEATFVI